MKTEEIVPLSAMPYFHKTLAGDPYSAALLWNEMNPMDPYDDRRGQLCWLLFGEGCPPPSLSVVVEATWRRDPGLLHGDRHAINHYDYHSVRSDMLKLFSCCQFPKPRASGYFRVYRGVAGVGLSIARKGFSWTTSKDGAAAYARYASNALKCPPLIIAADIQSKDISLHAHLSRCDEMVVFDESSTQNAWVVNC